MRGFLFGPRVENDEARGGQVKIPTLSFVENAPGWLWPPWLRAGLGLPRFALAGRAKAPVAT